MAKKLYPCMLCERRYAEMEEAEVCERSHTEVEREVQALRERVRLIEAEGAHGWCDDTIQKLMARLEKCTCGAGR